MKDAMTHPGSGADRKQTSALLRRAGLLFAAMIACFAVWVFTLPVFPTQDGPMHRYYIHVLDALLHHSALYGAYVIRHPFPPYATHYFILMELSHVFSYDVAEKLLIVGILGCFAYGLRFCAMGCGRAGNVLSFFAAPLLLHWALMMGFFNYSIALGLFLLIAGCWQRAIRGRRVFWIPFVLLVCLVTVTHPVPLLILTALCLLDLLLRALLLRRRAASFDTQTLVLACCALAFCLVAFRIPAASMQSHATESIFADFGFHARGTGQMLLLAGISPFYTLARGILPNLYRLALYGIFIGAMYMAARAFLLHWRERRLGFSDTFFISTILLALAIPVLPDYVNGSGFFATRMVVLLWMGALIAASGGEFRSERTPPRALALALVVACISLLAAQVYFRPLANALAGVESQPLPQGQKGLLLVGIRLDDHVRHRYQVSFDPFTWAPALAFVRADDVILDSPWIDQNITPIESAPGSPILIDDIRMTHLSHTDPGFQPNAPLPQSREPALTHEARFLLYADTPDELNRGLADVLMPEDAAQFQCSRKAWYLVCVAR
jgi:hypothetical protein